MALKYRAKMPELIDALAVAGISTAAKLADVTKLATGTAQAVFRGHDVSLQTAIEVVHHLQQCGAEVAVSTAFDEVKE